MKGPIQSGRTSSGQSSIFDLTGKVAVVTGAGRGIGQSVALGLARNGADVAVISRNSLEVQQVAEMIRQEGKHSLALVCDVSNRTQVIETVTEIITRFEKVDVLVNNAGITKRIPTIEFSPNDFEEVIKVNLKGAFFCCQVFGKTMIDRKQGSIINIGALSGLIGLGRGNAVYSATKGALFAMTRDLACEWGPSGIRVNALAPYWFRTQMIAPLLENKPLVKQILSRIPLGRIGEPSDLVGSVVFFASDASALITGQVLVIDGGVSTTFLTSTQQTIDPHT